MMKITKHIEFPIMTFIISSVYIFIQLLTGLNYPIFRDELYYIDCANHPAFGYVDHPPLSIWILMTWKFIFGDSQISLRIIPAICGGLLIMLTSLLSKDLGGNKSAQIFASAAVFSGLYYIATGGFYSMNVIDSLFWALLFLMLIKIIKKAPDTVRLSNGERDTTYHPDSPLSRDTARGDKEGGLWLLFGIIAGLGLMNKISVGYLGLGIFTAILFTRNRAWLKHKNIWLGGIIAAAIFSPYVIWNMLNDYATLEFIKNAQRFKIAALSPLDFLKEQILLINPLSAPLWITGLFVLLFSRSFRYFRIIGITYVVIFVLLIILRSKAYYLAAAYPVLIAAGAVAFCRQRPIVIPAEAGIRNKEVPSPPGREAAGQDTASKPDVRNLIISIYVVLILTSAIVLSPMVIPVFSPEDTARHIKALGIMPSSGERNRQSELPQILADRFGWKELTDKAAKIYTSLPENEKKHTGIFAENYGEAGAINYYGRKYLLPQCFSGHNNHFLWGPPGDSLNALIVIGGDIEDERELFDEVYVIDSTYHHYAMPSENNEPIYLVRKPKQSLKEIWNRVKFYI